MPTVSRDKSPAMNEDIAQDTVWRKLNTAKADVLTRGITSGCPGCVVAIRGAAPRKHTESCSGRMEEDIAQQRPATI